MSVHLVSRGEGSPSIYRQIHYILMQEIQELYSAGDILPAETELAERFGVNRHTLRRAIDELVLDGLVERYHGKGVFVLESSINYSINSNTRFTETLESQGHLTTSRVMRKKKVPARGGVALRLQIQEGEEVVYIETLRSVEGKPFCVISHFLPLKICPLVLERYENGSLHSFLQQHSGIEIERSESLISAVLPETDDARLLNMSRQFPVLRVKSINLNKQSTIPVEYAITRFRGDAAQLSIKPSIK